MEGHRVISGWHRPSALQLRLAPCRNLRSSRAARTPRRYYTSLWHGTDPAHRQGGVARRTKMESVRNERRRWQSGWNFLAWTEATPLYPAKNSLPKGHGQETYPTKASTEANPQDDIRRPRTAKGKPNNCSFAPHTYSSAPAPIA